MLNSLAKFSCTIQDTTSNARALGGIASSLNHLHFDSGSATLAAPGEMCRGFFYPLVIPDLDSGACCDRWRTAALGYGDLSTV